MAKKVISDQQGQRKFPWQTTKIKGNIMSTEGYGDIPLWVVPDKGTPRMIYPNTGEHHFPEASSFTEHPQVYPKREINLPQFLPDANLFEGWNEPMDWQGENYKDVGASFGKGNLSFNAGNYIPTRTFEKTGMFNPYIGANFDLGKNINMGINKSADYTGLSFSKTFQKGGSSESTGVYIRPDKLNFNKEKLPRKLPKSVNDLVRENRGQYEQKNRQLEERDYAQYVNGIENPDEVNKYVSLLDPTGAMDFHNIVENGFRNNIVNPSDLAGAAVNLIPGISKGRQLMRGVLNGAGKSGDIQNFTNEYQTGGQMKKLNKGFKSLPKYVQKHILENMKQAGGESDYDYMQMGGAADYTLFMGEDLPVMQSGGGAKKITSINPADYKYAFDRFDKMGAGNYDIAAMGNKIGINNAVKTHGNSVGINTLAGFNDGKNPLYTKDGHVLMAHPDGSGAYVNIGYANDPKFSANPLPVNSTPVVNNTNQNVASVNTGITTNTVPKKPFVFSPYQTFDPNKNTYGDPITGEKIDQMTGTGNELSKHQYGGANPFITNNVNKYLNAYYKKYGGGNAPQGESLDDVLQKKNQDFVNYIANNTKAALFKGEAMDFQKGFAKWGQQVNNEDDPNNSGTDYNSGTEAAFNGAAENSFGSNVNSNEIHPGANWSDFVGGPFGAYGTGNNGVPQYVTDMKAKYDIKTPVKKQQGNWSKNNTADALMAGAQGINNMFNKFHANQQNLFNQNKNTIENTAGTSYGSRGDYDVNQGNFRVDQKVAPKYKKGGVYKDIDHKTVQDLLAQGYELEFLD